MKRGNVVRRMAACAILAAIAMVASVPVARARAVPTLGNLQITDTAAAAPGYTWTSPVTGNANFVPKNDALKATLDVTYNFTKVEKGLIDAGNAVTVKMRLDLDADRSFYGFGDKDIARSSTSFDYTTNPQTVIYAPPGFNTTQFGALSVGDTRADFEIELITGEAFRIDPETAHIELTDGTPPTSGAAAGARAGTAGVTYNTPQFHAFRVTPPGPPVHIYAVDSTDGSTFQIKGFNDSGFSLALASGDALLVDYPQEPNPDPPNGHHTYFDPSVTFARQYVRNAPGVGTLSQPGDIWVVMDGDVQSQPIDLMDFSRTSTPALLPGDGQTISISATSIHSGTSALWILFDTGNDTSAGFLITGSPPAIPALSGWSLLVLVLLLLTAGTVFAFRQAL